MSAESPLASAQVDPGGEDGAVRETATADGRDRLPLRALLAMATAVFITSLTETLPAGVLPQLGASLRVGEGAAGQAVTVYAAATTLTAIPLAAATSAWSRKRLLLAAMAGFATANTVMALSSSYPLVLVARFAAGMAAGVAWALIAGYAQALAPVRLRGRAVAVAMAGIPLALSVGVPAGAFAARELSWRAAFLGLSGVCLVLLGWIAALVPDLPGRHRAQRVRLLPALRIPGVVPVLTVTLLFVLAHTVLYTYISVFLTRVGMRGSVGPVLLVFGGACLLSIWAVGAHIHGRLRLLRITCTLLVGAAAVLLALPWHGPATVYSAAALWGLGWGGVPTLLQTAVGQAGGAAADTAQAMLVTLWNAAMAGGGAAGAGLLAVFGAGCLPWAVAALLAPSLLATLAARRAGFPGPPPREGAHTLP